jgi:L,D-transpeptidase YbiS
MPKMNKSAKARIHISVPEQRLVLWSGRKKVATYPVSTSRFGLGTQQGSMKTPIGRFRIAEAIGDGMPVGTVFKTRRPVRVTKKILQAEDVIMTRILWLDGLDPGNTNTHDRFIYIHGTNHEESIGTPSSHGCIRMRNADLVELFEQVGVDTPVVIEA